MLYVSLILAAVLLASTNGIAYGARSPGGKIVGVCLVFLLGLPFLGLILQPVVILAAFLPVAVIVRKESARRGRFLRLSLGVTLVAFGLATLLALDDARRYERLRAAYPFESMEGRVPAPRPESRAKSLSPDALSRLDDLERVGGSGGLRSWRLQRLHAAAVDLFINSYGFGVGRLGIGNPTEANLTADPQKGSDPRQPGPRPSPARSPGEWTSLTAEAEAPLFALHRQGLFDFVNPASFGYVKDRRHVAGFQPHRVSGVPEVPRRWRVRTLDLVGLLLHDEPRVYVSEKLPRMDELRGAPTRPLDPFEAQALKAILGGDDLVVVRDGDVVRMLGSIRSTRQCIACHAGERGDLLGAFSYTLRHDEEKAAPPAQPVASNDPRSAASPPPQ